MTNFSGDHVWEEAEFATKIVETHKEVSFPLFRIQNKLYDSKCWLIYVAAFSISILQNRGKKFRQKQITI